MSDWLAPPRDYYAQNTLEVAQQLLGAELQVMRSDATIARVRIVETEAYVGPDDRASHASRGRTSRTEIMFGPPGYAYVFLIYGVHNCLNVVTEVEGIPAAVLIRAAEPVEGVEGRTDGPGRLCRALGIDRSHNGLDMTRPPLMICQTGLNHGLPIDSGPRVGVSYAGEWALKPWRFWIRGNPWVSRPSRQSIGLGEPIEVIE